MKEGNDFKVLKADNYFYNKELSKLYSKNNINVEEIDRVEMEPGMVLDFSDFEQKYKQQFPDSFLGRIGNFFKKS